MWHTKDVFPVCAAEFSWSSVYSDPERVTPTYVPKLKKQLEPFKLKAASFFSGHSWTLNRRSASVCPRKTSGLPWLICRTRMGFIVRRFGRQMVCDEVTRARARVRAYRRAADEQGDLMPCDPDLAWAAMCVRRASTPGPAMEYERILTHAQWHTALSAFLFFWRANLPRPPSVESLQDGKEQPRLRHDDCLSEWLPLRHCQPAVPYLTTPLPLRSPRAPPMCMNILIMCFYVLLCPVNCNLSYGTWSLNAQMLFNE